MSQLLYLIALSNIPMVGPVMAKSLIAYCGGAEEVFKCSRFKLEKVPGVGQIAARNIRKFKDFATAEESIMALEKHQILHTTYLDQNFPFRLKQIPDCPLVLYHKNNLKESAKAIAIVGTRKITPYGKQFLKSLIKQLKDQDVVIYSGLAYGVDEYAHRYCMEYGIITYGVMAHGLDKVYPAVHKKMARKMIEQSGGLISEYLVGVDADREHFPARNRIIAGLVDVVIVIESPEKGGSLITADLANQYNREVMALPGSIYSGHSKGTNRLIKKHKAHLIEDVIDLLELMNWDRPLADVVQTSLFHDLDNTEQSLLNLIRSYKDADFDLLLKQSSLKNADLATLLLELELKNCISSLPGKRYKAL